MTEEIIKCNKCKNILVKGREMCTFSKGTSLECANCGNKYVFGENDKNKWTYINLRMPTDMVSKIDHILEHRMGITRTGWILEALQEKIKRMPADETNQKNLQYDT